MSFAPENVCFTPKSGHWTEWLECPLRAYQQIQKDRLAAVSPKIHECFDTLKLARSAASTLQVSRSAASAGASPTR